MRNKEKTLLAFVLMLIVAVSVATAAQQVSHPGRSVGSVQSPSLNAPAIEIILIKVAPALPGNSEPVNVGIRIVSGATNQDICGLDASNFNLETLTVPPGGPAIVIKNIYPTSAVAVNQPVSCNYWLDMVPTSYQGSQYTWLTGTYTLKLNYAANGKQLASKVFNFRV
jgi:hypothetical protein